ncbi:Dentin sialophosphoprotein [Paenibacillus nuruki]|uniref:Dentin sialophosphoprotein n=1 Tax=Paenibacillus nuruki TaxID=1886670 RepID=A0A1E3L7Q7_9BACL|nr:hypothetical protein [Paenibacillus nuruki]ODP29786.1 Dentin sialophosphoprotein [Paenibacillus nuruki]
MKKWTFLLGTTMTIALLAGCSTNSETSSTAEPTTNTADASATATSTNTSSSSGDSTAQANADLMGKIKSIDGNMITIYKSTIDPSQMVQGGGKGMSAPPEGQPGDGGASPADGGQSPPATPDGESAQAPVNEGSQAPASSEQASTGGKDMFSDETVTITVSDSTTFSTMTMENNEMTTTTKALSDLKADDVINVWLNTDDSSVADQIQLFNGMGGGMRSGQMKGDISSQDTSSDTTSTDHS